MEYVILILVIIACAVWAKINHDNAQNAAFLLGACSGNDDRLRAVKDELNRVGIDCWWHSPNAIAVREGDKVEACRIRNAYLMNAKKGKK